MIPVIQYYFFWKNSFNLPYTMLFVWMRESQPTENGFGRAWFITQICTIIIGFPWMWQSFVCEWHEKLEQSEMKDSQYVHAYIII